MSDPGLLLDQFSPCVLKSIYVQMHSWDSERAKGAFGAALIRVSSGETSSPLRGGPGARLRASR